MPDTTTDPVLTGRFEEAVLLALDLHRLHCRNSTTVPYASHLMSVAALVLEDGGDEDEAIAALLHDALEDCADRISGDDIERRFGARVRTIVEACTDTPPEFGGGMKPAWRPRKERYMEHLRRGDTPTRVSLADKVHNARSILRDHRIEGDAVWDRFTPDMEDTLWYYGELAQAYRDAGTTGFLIGELERIVHELHERAGVTMTTRNGV